MIVSFSPSVDFPLLSGEIFLFIKPVLNTAQHCLIHVSSRSLFFDYEKE